MTMPQETITAQDILRKSVDRNRYFRGKLLTVRDLTQEQDYLNSKRWLLNRLLFGAGAICGLQVGKVGGELAVLIKAGLALDPLGREVTVIDDRKVDLASTIKLSEAERIGVQTKTGYICLSHRDCPKEPAPSFNASPCETSCESSRWHETFDVSWDEDDDPKSPPTLCASWLNRVTVQASDEDGNLVIERTTPVWVRRDEVFQVALRVTAARQEAKIRISELVTNGLLIEPRPALAQKSQFPTPLVNLRVGEFFVYVYQVSALGNVGLLTVNVSTLGLPNPVSTVEVVSDEDATKNESQFDLQRSCPEPKSTCVRIAKLTVRFEAGKPVTFSIRDFPAPRFRYSLERVTEMLDCVRASLTSEAGSPRPGHAFVTFNDFDAEAPAPIGPNASPGTGFTFSGGSHAHALLRAPNSGLEFTGAGGNELRINGDVGGGAIKFLNTVKGVSPIAEKDLVTKDYVDAHIAGLDWQESVLDKELTAPPSAQKEGDRYLLFNEPTETWKGAKVKGQKNDIATFNGKVWEFTAPDEGTAVFVEDENVAYLFVDGNWIPFLAAPEMVAGDGLVAKGAILSVGIGTGIVVNPNDVAVAIETKLLPQPIGPVASAGDAKTLSAANHIHALELAKEGGLIFDKRGVRIEGGVSGERINFLNPVGGQEPKDATHLATRKYVDDHASGITAGNGLVRKENTVMVGQGAGIKVNTDNVAVAFDGDLPRPIAAVAFAGESKNVSSGGHVHALPLSDASGLVIDAKGLRIDGIVGGKTTFNNPVEGPDPSSEAHFATKRYVDNRFSSPDIRATSGVFIFTPPSPTKRFTLASASINPELGEGAISVQLAFLDPNAGDTYYCDATNLSSMAKADGFPNLLQFALASKIKMGAPTTFQILVDILPREGLPLPANFQVRWFAYLPRLVGGGQREPPVRLATR
jgi:hypothetical protein